MTAALVAEARAHLARQTDAAPPSVRAQMLAGDVSDDRTRLLVRLTNALEDEQRMRHMDTDHVRDLEAKIAAADAAFQQLHYSCDNPDHAGAYQALATALGYYTQEER